MFRRYTYIPIIVLLLTGAGWWARQVESSSPRPLARSPQPELVMQTSVRRELLEALDRLVSYENYYHSVYGHYTKLLPRVGFTIPRSIAELYDIRVAEASPDRLLVTAISEIDGKTIDFLSIDQDYRFNSNFSVPPPRQDYLRVRAIKHLRALRDSQNAHALSEIGIFRDYFRYEVKRDSEDRKIAFAVGVRPPVAGLQLEVGPQNALADPKQQHEIQEDLLGSLSDEEKIDVDSRGTGQASVGNVMSTLEEVYLAQRIFRGETGRYAKNWSELSRIAAFRFEDKEKYGDDLVPFGDSGMVPELEAKFSDVEIQPGRTPAFQSNRASKRQLIIEPMKPGEFE